MRGSARPLTGTVLAVAAAGVLVAPAYAAPADHLSGIPAGTTADALEVYPSSAVPGDHVTVNTAACGKDGAATGDATAVGAGRFTLVPTAHEEDLAGRFRVPPSAVPGTYEIVARCAGNNRRVTGDLVVTLTSATHQVAPRGSVKTGVGGALGPDPVRTAAGVAALAVAAAGGTWLLHRRARGDGI